MVKELNTTYHPQKIGRGLVRPAVRSSEILLGLDMKANLLYSSACNSHKLSSFTYHIIIKLKEEISSAVI